ncbi:MAG: hypothetical protein Q7T94_00390 [Rugosibacter sp.]|jgi:hypothetical protein|nr:hypothetical protein [Rugosibacter sp.]
MNPLKKVAIGMGLTCLTDKDSGFEANTEGNTQRAVAMLSATQAVGFA